MENLSLLMGCAPSLLDDNDEARQKSINAELMEEYELGTGSPHKTLAAFIEIDRNIVENENANPAPNFGHLVTRLQQARQLLQIAENGDILSNKGNSAPNPHQDHEGPDDATVYQLFLDLGIQENPKIVAEHEEFIANVNRRVLQKNMLRILKEKIIRIEERLEVASQNVSTLQGLYQKQDILLRKIFGENYSGDREKIFEQELDTMRNYLDTLVNGVLNWEDVAKDTQSSADLAHRGLISWKSLKNQKTEKRLKLAAEARNCFQEAIFLVQISQDILSDVHFPYCTTREVSSMLQAVEYIFTDILIEERYQHALQVYKNFYQRVVALHEWILKTLESTLKADLHELEDKVTQAAARLKDERIQLICKKLKISYNYNNQYALNPIAKKIQTAGNTNPIQPDQRYTEQSLYGPVYPQRQDGYKQRQWFNDPSIQREFEEKLAARRNSLWPSRRVEELRMLTTNV